jgi:NAD(P)-dependent dehydrogenase (short-subunit alcohol dehydrogenase family)
VRFANEGARVVIADRANAQQTLDLVATSGGTATAIICDVSNPESVAALKTEVESNIGQCDILINNAGIFPTQRFEDIVRRQNIGTICGEIERWIWRIC